MGKMNSRFDHVAVCFVAMMLSLEIPVPVRAEAPRLVHKRVIDVGQVFGQGKPDGGRAVSLVCDGANIYLGGINAGMNPTIGIVKIANVFTADDPAMTPLEQSRFAAPKLKAYDSLAFDEASQSLIASHDSGKNATSFIRRISPEDGSSLWSMNNFTTGRPAAIAVDPIGDHGKPAVAFLVSHDPQLRVLSLEDASEVEPTEGVLIESIPNNMGRNWRALAIDSKSIAIAATVGFAYGSRPDSDKEGKSVWRCLNGIGRGTSSLLIKNDNTVCTLGQSIVILRMKDLPQPVLAFSCQNAKVTQVTDSKNTARPVSAASVHLCNLDGTTDGLAQATLHGDEDNVGAKWVGIPKSLWFGIANGRPTLLVLGSTEYRLDVYEISQ